eukprot:gene6113-7618_t
MPRLKLPQSFYEDPKSTKESSSSKKKVDEKQTSISSFFTPLSTTTTSNTSETPNQPSTLPKDNKTTPTTTTTNTKKNQPKDTDSPSKTPTPTKSKSPTPAKKKTNSKVVNDEDDILDDLNTDENNENEKSDSFSRLSKRRSTRVDTSSFLNVLSSDSEDDKPSKKKNSTIGKKRKNKEEEDYESEEEEESEDDYVSDNDATEDEESEEEEVKKKPVRKNNSNPKSSSTKSKPMDIDQLDSFQFKKKTTPTKNSKKGQDEDEYQNISIDLEDLDKMDEDDENSNENNNGEWIKISDRVSLPPGTPSFKNNPTAGKKLLKALEEYQKRKEEAASGVHGKRGEDGEEEEEEEEKPKGKGRAAGKSTKANTVKYTPLEQQYLDIKKANPDTLLMVECGYRYRFFGEDAEIANKVLNIYCYMAKNFFNASVPTHRVFFHLRRLIMAGYKVGIVEQTETAAIKAASSSKSQPFSRKLTRIYTSSTFIDDVNDDSAPENSSPNYLVSFYETTEKKGGDPTISFIAVSISTGEIIYDCFVDNILRSQLETILTHLKPSEILLPPESHFSELSKKCLKHYCKSQNIRTQTMSQDLYNFDVALTNLNEFYESHNLEAVVDSIRSFLKESQIICLGVLYCYLKQFIQFSTILKLSSNFKPFRIVNHLILPHSTIKNLEILANEYDGTEKGSLFWTLNRTQTCSGRRLFINWVCKPLNKLNLIKERQDAVTELLKGISTNSHALESIQNLFKSGIPDLQRNLSRIYYKSQCSPKEFLSTMESFQRISKVFTEISESKPFQSKILVDLFKMEESKDGGPDNRLISRINYFLSSIRADKANECIAVSSEKSAIWTDLSKYPKIQECQETIASITSSFDKHLKEARKETGKPTLEYIHMPKLNLEYLIEVPVAHKKIPKDWTKVSATQKLVRYHSPFILEKLKELALSRDLQKVAAQEAWMAFLSEVIEDYSLFSNFINKLSNLDCLLSLAKVSNRDGYTCPEFKESPGVQIQEGRHPIIESLLTAACPYVPNSISLDHNAERSMIITGPNMGGKSSFIRQTSLIVIMAQIGCYVPAESCKMGVFDAIYTRMGAHDDIATGSSTFFVELQETSEILRNATPNSLVILDELGRGTSTHDGVSIAYATLKYITEKLKSFCLFVTHYPLLADLEHSYPGIVGNYHMGFIEEPVTEQDPIPKVVFLYKVTKGAAKNSYGLNVATIAGVPKQIIMEAAKKSDEMKTSISEKAALTATNNNFEIQQLKSLLSNKQNLQSTDLINQIKQIQINLKK